MRPWLSFFVPGLPIPQPAAAHGTNAAGGTYHYVPNQKPIHRWRAMVALEGARARGGRPLMIGPVALRALLIFPRGNKELRASPDTFDFHIKKPDIKNLLAGLEDSLKGIVWVDDCQNCDSRLTKRYTIGNEAPGTHVEIGWAIPPKEFGL